MLRGIQRWLNAVLLAGSARLAEPSEYTDLCGVVAISQVGRSCVGFVGLATITSPEDGNDDKNLLIKGDGNSKSN